jgi:hypothetical protein
MLQDDDAEGHHPLEHQPAVDRSRLRDAQTLTAPPPPRPGVRSFMGVRWRRPGVGMGWEGVAQR